MFPRRILPSLLPGSCSATRMISTRTLSSRSQSQALHMHVRPLAFSHGHFAAGQQVTSCLRQQPVAFSRGYSSGTADTSDTTSEADDGSTAAHGQHEAGGSGQSQRAKQDRGSVWQDKLLTAALSHVPTHGWSMACIEKAAGELNLSSAVGGMLRNGAADLVLHFERQSNEQLVQLISDWKEEQTKAGGRVGVGQIIKESVKQRLAMIQPHLGTWHEALALLAQPSVAPEAFRLLLHVVDDVWHLAGDQSTDVNWYTKRATLAAVYCSTELFMLQDKSANNEETWQFLERRLADVGSIGKLQASVQQALCTAVELGGLSVSTMQKLSRTLPPLTSDDWTRPFTSNR